MAKRIKKNKSSVNTTFYIIDDYTNPQNKKKSTFVFEKLGNLNDLMKRFDVDCEEAAIKKLKEYVNELRELDKKKEAGVTITLYPNREISDTDKRMYNIGYLYPRNILFNLGIKKICDTICSNYQFHFDLSQIISDLICTQIISPNSKCSSYDFAHSFFQVPQYSLDSVYRSLPVLAKNRYYIESELYKNSDTLYNRNTSILYYDCTNFYFEIEEETDQLRYGKSKENRPNPIVQYGLFMDTNGIPIADYVFDGNKNEQSSLRELEDKLESDFKLSRFIVCADAGLNGWDNKVYNDRKKDGAYIVTKPIRKMTKALKKWALEPTGWKIIGHNDEYDISKLGKTIVIDGITRKTSDVVFYKDRWETTTKKYEATGKKYTLEEHIIVSFNKKYQIYQKRKRDKKIERARKLLNNPGKIGTKNERDPRYYIKTINTTKEGEVAEQTYNIIDESKIVEQEQYDGFYCVTTDLEDEDISLIINANKQRWEIEENFRIMKSEFKARPMYVTKEESVQGHLLICFIALMVYRILEKKYLKEMFTCYEIIDTLRSMQVTHLKGSYYTPSFEKTEITDRLKDEFGFSTSGEVIDQKYLNKFLRIVNSRKFTKLKSK